MDRDTIKETIRGTLLSFENGFDLFNAAKLLYEVGFYSVSVTLCVLSQEELGKTHIIGRSLYINEDDKKERKDWYYKKFKNHLNKSGAAIFSHKYSRDFIDKDILNEENELEAIKDARISNKAKEIGIYVDIDDSGKFYSPKEVISKSFSINYLKYTKEIVGDYCLRYRRIKEIDTDTLINYYEEMILLGEKYEIGKIQDKESYNSEKKEKIKAFKDGAIKIATKYNFNI